MNKLFTKALILCMSVVTVLGIASVASAQSGTYRSTSLFVTDVTLDRGTYAPGEEVNGSFIVHNINGFGVNDANYVISLGADYVDGGIPTNIIETSDRIKIPFLREGSKQTVNFSYTLPAVIGGDNFGINIRAVLDSGAELGWGDAQFELSGKGLSLVEVDTAYLAVLNEPFGLGTGPTVYPGDDAHLFLSIDSPEDITLTPSVVIRSQFDNEVVYNTQLEDIQASANQLLDYKFDLPLEFAPGVYLGEIEMLDSNSINRISKVEFRYIIGGQIGTIQGIYTDRNEAARGEVLGVSINISGTPIDIVRSSDLYTKSAKLEVLIKDNLSGEIIGGETVNIDELTDQTYNLEVDIDQNTANIRVEAILYGSDGQILDEYSITQPQGEMPEGQGNLLISIISISIAVVLLLITGFILKRRNQKNDSDSVGSVGPGVIGLMLLIVLVFSFSYVCFADFNFGSFYGLSDNTSQFVKTEYTGGINVTDRHLAYNITVNSPLPPAVKKYSPGETFNFQVDFKAIACINKAQNLKVYTLKQDVWSEWTTYLTSHLTVSDGGRDTDNISWWKESSLANIVYSDSDGFSSGKATIGKHEYISSFLTPAAGGYKVPEEEGIHRLYFFFYIFGNGSEYGTRLSYVEIEVEGETDPLVGKCGPLDGGIITSDEFNDYPKSNLCASGELSDGSPREKEDGTGWEWECLADNYDDECFAGLRTMVDDDDDDGGDDEECDPSIEDCGGAGDSPGPVISSVKMFPTIVNEGGKCTFSWRVTDIDSTGICTVSDGQSKEYQQGTDIDYSVQVEPQRSYSVTCVDVAIPLGSDTSNTLSCNLNPTIIEN